MSMRYRSAFAVASGFCVSTPALPPAQSRLLASSVSKHPVRASQQVVKAPADVPAEARATAA